MLEKQHPLVGEQDLPISNIENEDKEKVYSKK